MILIDASNLSQSGGGELLKYLLCKLRSHHTHTIVSPRVGIEESDSVSHCNITNPLSSSRQRMLEEAVVRWEPNHVLLIGNLPPRKPLKVRSVSTYFHNAHLIASLDVHTKYSWKDKLRYSLLRDFIQKRLVNTDHWIFQTSFIRDAFLHQYRTSGFKSHVLPFYDHDQLVKRCGECRPNSKESGYVYLSDDRPHKNHQRLLQAWDKLAKDSRFPQLHLTVSNNNRSLKNMLDSLRRKGCQILNHGPLPREDALALMARYHAAIFPSLLETIGLGLVEGALLGNVVICSNSESLSNVLVPSLTFDPLDSTSIAGTIAVSMDRAPEMPKVVLKDQVEELIAHLLY